VPVDKKGKTINRGPIIRGQIYFPNTEAETIFAVFGK
jgi:hypothetical protein